MRSGRTRSGGGAVLLAAWLAGACSSLEVPAAQTAAASAPPSLTGLELFVPANAEAIVSVDYARLRARGFARLFADAAPDAAALQRLRDQRGFSEADDVDRALTVTFPGGGGAGPQAPTTLEMYEGRFEPSLVKSAFTRRHDASALNGATGAVYVAADGDRALSLPDDHLVLAGPPDSVRAALDCRARDGACLSQQTWDAQLRTALDRSWGSQTQPQLEVRVRVGEDMRERLRNELGDGDRLLWFGLRVSAGRGLDVLLVARARDKREATDFAERLGGMAAELGRRPLASALGLGAALEGVRVGASGDQVEATLHLDPRDWSALERRLEVIAAAVRDARAKDQGGTPSPDRPSGGP